MTKEMLVSVQKNIVAKSKTIVNLSKASVPNIRSCFEQKPFRPIGAERDHIEIILKNNILLYDKNGKQIFSGNNGIYGYVSGLYSLVAKNFGSIEEQRLNLGDKGNGFENIFSTRNKKLMHNLIESYQYSDHMDNGIRPERNILSLSDERGNAYFWNDTLWVSEST